jgi:hypothetical protein
VQEEPWRAKDLDLRDSCQLAYGIPQILCSEAQLLKTGQDQANAAKNQALRTFCESPVSRFALSLVQEFRTIRAGRTALGCSLRVASGSEDVPQAQ